MLKFTLELNAASKALLEKDKIAFRAGMRKGLIDAMYFLEAAVKKSFGTSGKPKVRTGALRRSIQGRVVNNTEGRIGSNLIYAPVMEFGALIKARRAKYLTFKVDGQWRKVKQVTIPARPFFYPTIEENVQKVGNIILNRIEEAIK